MSANQSSKWTALEKTGAFNNMAEADRTALYSATLRWRFSHQELRQLAEWAVDFRAWGERPLLDYMEEIEAISGKQMFRAIRAVRDNLLLSLKSYKDFLGTPGLHSQRKIVSESRNTTGFGLCPVASAKTRCCGLQTLDSVEGCSFDCSYCAVGGFYQEDQIGLNLRFAEKLRNLTIDPKRIYHVGTGQSSDSLLWGNREKTLENLLNWAGEHPNVILELKTKSDNIEYLMKNSVPSNVLCTWSLNTETIIKNEEHGTSSLESRLRAAEIMANRGTLVGFHFHPIVDYQEREKDYNHLYSEVVRRFRPEDVVTISFGTLTFTRPVIRAIRARKGRSRILQMPLIETAGKLSYPLEVKRTMFRQAYDAFFPWHGRVFFYLCMENPSLWTDVFGMDYQSNEEFEFDMLKSYQKKINEKRLSYR